MWLIDLINDWLKQWLIEAIMASFSTMFDSVNFHVGNIAEQVGQTPEGWNSGVFSMVQSLAETVILPVAGIILTFVLCYELIQLIIEKNNLQDFDTFNIFKWIFSATRSYTNTIPQVKIVWALRPSGAKNRGFSVCNVKKTTTDTLTSGMMG